jgi:hypothetical protein
MSSKTQDRGKTEQDVLLKAWGELGAALEELISPQIAGLTFAKIVPMGHRGGRRGGLIQVGRRRLFPEGSHSTGNATMEQGLHESASICVVSTRHKRMDSRIAVEIAFNRRHGEAGTMALASRSQSQQQ